MDIRVGLNRPQYEEGLAGHLHVKRIALRRALQDEPDDPAATFSPDCRCVLRLCHCPSLLRYG